MIVFDLDGVLVDFHGGMLKYGFDVDSVERRECWDLLIKQPTIWAELDPLPGYKKLIQAAKDTGLDIFVLTGGVGNYYHCGLHKTAWVRKHMGDEYPVYCIDSKLKADFARTGYILIDDKKSNIDSWVERGGIGILHTSVEDSISQLNTIMKNYERVPNKIPGYAGYLIPDAVRQMIFERFPPKVGLERFEFICHHITRMFPAGNDLPPNAFPVVRAYAYGENDTHQTLFVTVDGEQIGPSGKPYHITLAMANGEKDVEARGKKVAAKDSINVELQKIEPFEFVATYRFFGQQKITHKPVRWPTIINEYQEGELNVKEVRNGDIVTYVYKKDGEPFNDKGPRVHRMNSVTGEILYQSFGDEFSQASCLSWMPQSR